MTKKVMKIQCEENYPEIVDESEQLTKEYELYKQFREEVDRIQYEY
jgi:hypothetical protein